MHKILVTLLLIGFLSLQCYGQQSAIYTNDHATFNKALSLYNSNQYLAAQTLFQEVKEDTKDVTIAGDCAYYIANAAVRLNQMNADQLMQDFVEEFPTSTKRNAAFLDVATYYFENGKYTYARKWYDRIDPAALSQSAREDFNFRNGYAYFKSKDYDQAKKYFNRVRDSQKYGAQAKYYEGFMAYESDEYQEANTLFEAVEADGEYGEELAYFKADLNFKLGKFEEAIQEGKKQLPIANRREISELNKIIGESYFNLGQYETAIPYLKAYKGKGGKWNNTDYYQLGYAYFKQNDFESAINEFNKIVDGRNRVAQNAYYHLAEAYLKTERKQEALNAFKNASEMDFDAKIKEDSSLNYAKLSYEIGNAYEPTPTVIANHLDAYPDSPATEELQSLLIDSYISSRNYKGAMELLENNRAFENKVAYQKVAFFLGVEQFNDGDYIGAIEAFENSLKEPRDARYEALATYWKAEAAYVRNNFDEAIIGYKQFLNNPASKATNPYETLSYNLGYAYFSNKQYDQAAPYFKTYTTQNPQDQGRLNDAYLRLGDSYFISSNYWPALEAYNKAIERNAPGRDYATFQKSMSYGFVNRDKQKIEGLEGFATRFPTSSYRDDALYELGNVYVAQNKNEQALRAYNRLEAEIPGSRFLARTLLKKALIYDNTGSSEQALSLLKRVASQFAGTPEALQAVSTAKLIYIDLGRVNEYGQWVTTLDFIEVADEELDDAAWASAEQQYLDQNNSQAERLLKEYASQYPNGKHALQANFYLGQLAFAKEAYAEATPFYEVVISRESSEYTEEALARLGQVYLAQKEYGKAIPVLVRLESAADFKQNKVFAQSNLMKSYYEQKEFGKAVSYAEKVLSDDSMEVVVKNDAHTIIARSAMKTGDESRAKAAYAQVEKNATGSLAAEALYYNAYFKNKEGAFAASNNAVQKLAKEYSGYKEYGAMGLILMAKNFYALDDAYQATYILESVITNFADYPEIVETAQSELTSIKTKEAKTNASVEGGK